LLKDGLSGRIAPEGGPSAFDALPPAADASSNKKCCDPHHDDRAGCAEGKALDEGDDKVWSGSKLAEDVEVESEGTKDEDTGSKTGEVIPDSFPPSKELANVDKTGGPRLPAAHPMRATIHPMVTATQMRRETKARGGPKL
jgi:hypothetical protein